jgi:hypothetical protein
MLIERGCGTFGVQINERVMNNKAVTIGRTAPKTRIPACDAPGERELGLDLGSWMGHTMGYDMAWGDDRKDKARICYI